MNIGNFVLGLRGLRRRYWLRMRLFTARRLMRFSSRLADLALFIAPELEATNNGGEQQDRVD